jgi:Putative Flp pilus-assembly TadE/G-like
VLGRVTHTHCDGERGAVMVIVAVAMFPLVAMLAFAIDTSHWFDYSRNLQNRADAAALAAGSAYGGVCFGNAGDVRTGAQSVLGKWAQLYSGPAADSDLPYTTGDVFASTDSSSYVNVPNLTLGKLKDYSLRLNANDYANNGGTNFAMGDFCNADPTKDATDKDPGPPGPMVDVKVTQHSLPDFVPVFGINPTINAHARVELKQATGESGVSPIAVADPAQTGCVVARVFDPSLGANGTLIQTITMSKATADPGAPVTFTGTGPAPITPTGDQLTVQAFLPDDCSKPNGSGTTYDDAADGGGIVFINTYKPLPATPPPTGVNVGSVFLTPAGCTDSTESARQAATTGSAYFFDFQASSSCTVTVNAQVDFPQQATSGNGVVITMDGSTKQTASGGTLDTSGHQLWQATFQISPQSGRHTFVVSYFNGSSPCQNASKSGTAACQFNGGNPLQETFAAVNDNSDPPDDSGPIGLVRIDSSVSGIITAGAVNSLPQGSPTTLAVTFQLRGLSNAQPGDPPIVLRNAVQNSKKTGFIDCGQGNGGSQISASLQTGCPHALTIYTGPSCPPASTGTPPWSCVGTVSGDKAGPMRKGMDDRIGTSCDNWLAYPGTPIPADDPRVMTLVITSPGDLTGSSGNGVVRVLGFAAFYVTGYDGIGKPSSKCPGSTDQNEANPNANKGSGGGSKFDIWGHFIKYVTSTGTPGRNPCDPSVFGDCVTALTR